MTALCLVVLNYIRAKDGQTILTKDIETDTKITGKTIRKNIKFLVENGYIRKDGKKYFVLKP